MRQDDFISFAKIIMGMSETYSRTLSESAIDIFWEVLKEYSLSEVELAIHQAITSGGQYMPTPGSIAELIKPQQDIRQKTETKWAGVLELMRRYDGLRDMKVIVDGATAFAVRNMGGWQSLTMMDATQIPFQITKFRALYEQACQEGLEKEQGEIEGRREKHWQTGEFYPQKIVAAPETLTPPPGIMSLQSQEQRQIENKVAQMTCTLKGKMAIK